MKFKKILDTVQILCYSIVGKYFYVLALYNYLCLGGGGVATKDYVDYKESLTEYQKDAEVYLSQEWSDEFYGLAKYREFADDWC